MRLNSFNKISITYFVSYKLIIFQFAFLVTQLLKLSLPMIMIFIVNNTLLNNRFVYIKESVVLSLLILLLFSFISYITNYFFIDYLNEKSKKLRQDIFTSCIISNSKFYENNNSGDMSYRILNDVNIIVSGWTFVFGSGISHIMSIIIFFFLIKFKLILLLFIMIMILLDISVVILYMKIIDSKIIKLKTVSQFLSKKLVDFLDKIEVINCLNLNNYSLGKIKENLEKVNLAKKDYYLTGKAFDIINNFISTVCSIVIIIVGNVFVKNNFLTLGALFAFISFSSLVFQPINSIIKGIMDLKNVDASSRRVFEYLDYTKTPYRNIHCIKKIKSIELENLSIYKNNKKILSGINYKLASPALYIIKGKNGAGKTLLAKTIAKIYTEYTGKIKVNDYDYCFLSKDDFESKIIYVNGNEGIFNESLRFNILLERNEFPQTENYEFIVNKFISRKFPLGLETELSGDTNIVLSNGEKQLIYIIRALILKPDVLILDEPELSLDIDVKEVLREIILKYSKTSIVILISHDYYFLDASENILELI